MTVIWVAAVIRGFDALKTYDTIFVISNVGPGTTSETLNILMYRGAFRSHDIGHASAIVVVFFVLVMLLILHSSRSVEVRSQRPPFW